MNFDLKNEAGPLCGLSFTRDRRGSPNHASASGVEMRNSRLTWMEE